MNEDERILKAKLEGHGRDNGVDVNVTVIGEDNITCDMCGKIIKGKPIKIISAPVSMDSDSIKIVRKEGFMTTTQYFCSMECARDAFGGWADVINPPKGEVKMDNYVDEPDGIFYCPTCNKRTNQKTYKTTCIKCGTMLQRRGQY